MGDTKFVFDIANDHDVEWLSQSIAQHLPYLVSSVDDIDQSIIEEALNMVVSDIVKSEMEQ